MRFTKPLSGFQGIYSRISSTVNTTELLRLEHCRVLPKIQEANLEIRRRVYTIPSNRDFHTTLRVLEFAILYWDF